MADSVEAQIAAEQANRRKKDKSSQRTDDKSSLSVKSANFDSDIYGSGSRGYDTSIAVGGSNGGDMDEDLDDSDRPVRLVDSCEQAMCTYFIHLLTLIILKNLTMLCTSPIHPIHSHRPEAPTP
jgi:hypothetical protein